MYPKLKREFSLLSFFYFLNFNKTKILPKNNPLKIPYIKEIPQINVTSFNIAKCFAITTATKYFVKNIIIIKINGIILPLIKNIFNFVS